MNHVYNDDFRLGEEPAVVVTITELVPLALAVAYLRPPPSGGPNPTPPPEQRNVIEPTYRPFVAGWGDATTTAEAIRRLSLAAAHIEAIHDLQGAVVNDDVRPIPKRHRGIINLFEGKLHVEEGLHPLPPARLVIITSRRSFRVEQDNVALVTEYSAHLE